MQYPSINELQAYLGQIYGPEARLTVVPYAYPIQFVTLAQNASSTAQLSITANADFVWLGLAYRAAIAAAQNVSTKTAAFLRLLITDSGSNEQFTSAAVDLENYSTNGGDARDLPYPRWIGGRSALTFQLTNYAPTAETYSSIDILLSGVLVRKFTG